MRLAPLSVQRLPERPYWPLRPGLQGGVARAARSRRSLEIRALRIPHRTRDGRGDVDHQARRSPPTPPAGGSTARWRRRVPTLSRERLKALISSGAVLGAGGRAGARSGGQGGARRAYEVAVPEPRPAHNEAQDIALEIVFEDEHLLVVDKPAGHGRPSGRRQFRRHPGQRPAPPLRRAPVGHRRRGAAGDRPPHRQGHVGAAGRRQDRRRA